MSGETLAFLIGLAFVADKFDLVARWAPELTVWCMNIEQRDPGLEH